MVTAYEKEMEDKAKTGVALSIPLIRAYFSHGRNCKNCRNCIYDCQGMSKGFRRNFEQGHDIRGPCALESPFRLFTIGEVCYDKALPDGLLYLGNLDCGELFIPVSNILYITIEPDDED